MTDSRREDSVGLDQDQMRHRVQLGKHVERLAALIVWYEDEPRSLAPLKGAIWSVLPKHEGTAAPAAP
jgi:hypothetical protein